LSRSTDSTEPYHGHMRKICDEYEMNEMSRTVNVTLLISIAI
jgi:hypothetical protein